MAVVSVNSLEAALVQAVKQEADRLREEEIRNAVDRFEKALRESVLKKAVDLTSYYDLRRSGESLVLTVRHGQGR